MTNKAKTYLKNLQEADTEKKLIGIEIAFKQDMTLSCNDLGSLCSAAIVAGVASLGTSLAGLPELEKGDKA